MKSSAFADRLKQGALIEMWGREREAKGMNSRYLEQPPEGYAGWHSDEKSRQERNMATETNLSERVKQAEKHVNEQLSYGGIFPGPRPFGSTLEYCYHDGDLEDEIGQMRRLADALNQLADALESEVGRKITS